jgi:MFS family permease
MPRRSPCASAFLNPAFHFHPVPPVPSPSSAPPSDSPPAASTPRVWRAGTLTYTTGGLIVLFLWLLWGDFSWAMRDRSVGPMAQWYLKHLEVPNLLFALLTATFPAAIGLVLGPIISYKSDRHRGPRGRRIPFLLITTPIAAAGMFGLALTPFISRWVHGHFPGQSEMVVAVVCFGIFWALFEFATIAANSVFGGLIGDVVPAPLLGRFYGLFRAVSLIDGMIFNYWLIGKVETHYTVMLLVIAAFYGTAFISVCLKVKEGDYPPPPPEPPGAPGPLGGFIGGAKIYFRECFSHGYYVWVFVMLTIASICFMPVNTFMIPYANTLGMSMDTYGKCLALTFTISLILAYPLGWLADLLHPLRMALGCLAGYMVVTAWGAVFARDIHSFSIALVLHGVLSGCYFTSAASLGLRLFPRSKYAQFASAAGLMGSICSMALGPLVGSVIDLTGNRYHHTFTAGCLLSLIALLAASHVHGKFMRLGGPKEYIAPA